MSMIINPYSFGIAGGASLYSLIMAASPVNYWRNGESSGTVMIDEVAADGVYGGAVALGSPALYPGGPTSVGGFNASGVIWGESTAYAPTLTDMTLVTVIRPTDLTGFKLIGVQRDNNSGDRKWQWRSNNRHMEFVKIAGGVTTVQWEDAFDLDQAYLVAFEVSAAGAWTMYRDGLPVASGSMPAGSYGGAGDPYRIGYAPGPATALVGTTGDNAVFDHVLGAAAQEAMAVAAGLRRTYSVNMQFTGADGAITFPDLAGNYWTRFGSAQVDTSLGFNTGEFTGSSWLTAPNTPDFNLYASDFRIQVRVTPIGMGDTQAIIGKWTTATSDQCWFLMYRSDGRIQFTYKVDGSSTYREMYSSTGAVAAGVETLIEITREGSLFTCYANGVSVGTMTYSDPVHTTTSSSRVYIGAVEASGVVWRLNARIRDLRVRKGSSAPF